METIPESCEDDDQLCSSSSVYTSRRTKLCSRCKALGSVQLFRVHSGHKQLELHKCLLVARSGYLSRTLKNSSHLSLPVDFPGGMQGFEAAVELCLGNDHNVLLDTSSIAPLRCAAEYLEMNTGAGNVCERMEVYLKHALTTWSDAVEVIFSCCCDVALPLAEELFIVNRCVESLASMICDELEQSWLRKTSAPKTWIRDVLRLPVTVFGRLILSCNRHGISPRNVSQLVVKYAEKWLFSESSDFEDEEDELLQSPGEQVLLDILDCVVRLLPFDRASVPVNFLFALLRYSIAIDSPSECRVQIESRIASQLDLASIDDLLMPFKSARHAPTLLPELDSMKRIVALFMSQCRAVDSNTGLANWEPVAHVAKVWDEYLAEVGYSASISAHKFAELIDAVPGFVRVSHDPLYKAIHIFLKAHPTCTQQDRLAICKPLDCQKLSHEACIHVVQNELMPLRTIVQAMFVQQLQARSSMKPNRRRISSKDRLRMCQDPEEIFPWKEPDQGLKADLEATNSKLESLEYQLLLIRKALEESVQVSDQPYNEIERGRSTGGSSSGGSVGRRISRAFQKMGIKSGLCKGNLHGNCVITPADKCFPMRSIHPEEFDQHLLGESIAPRLSTSSRDRDRDDIASAPQSKPSRRHSRRYSIS